MTTDQSVSLASAISAPKLVARVQQSADPDARELAARMAEALKHPERRVGAVFMPKPRGGLSPVIVERLQERDAALLELTDLQPGKRRSARIKEARLKLDRYAASGWLREGNRPDDTGNRERDLLRKIMRAGLPIPGERQHRAIVSGREK